MRMSIVRARGVHSLGWGGGEGLHIKKGGEGGWWDVWVSGKVKLTLFPEVVTSSPKRDIQSVTWH